MTYIIQISDQAVQAALDRVRSTVTDMQPIFQRIGESIMERTKQRFVTSTGPDGTPWAPNSPVTLARYIQTRGGKSTKKKAIVTTGKKPLIGVGGPGSLSQQFHINATNDSVTVASSSFYAAMQQFGGTKAQFPNLWGDIPARPFLPVTAGRQLYPEERNLIVEELQRYIQDAVS